VIEDHKIRRVRGTQTYTVDTRIIAAGMHDLQQGVKEGQFREDLYHRLDLLRIQIPPLWERGADILNLA
jgi:two-component system nitrogen regulation response regulator GlnG